MTIDELAAKLSANDGWVPGKRIRIDFGAAGKLMLDGVGGEVRSEGAADTLIEISLADLEALDRGSLDPMSAMMQGRLRIQGEMAAAMQLQALLAKLR